MVEPQGNEIVLHLNSGEKVTVESSIANLVWRFFDQKAETEFKFNPRTDDFDRLDR
jgi:hypothetical protein